MACGRRPGGDPHRLAESDVRPGQDVGLAEPSAIEGGDDAAGDVVDVGGRDAGAREGDVAGRAVVGRLELGAEPGMVVGAVDRPGLDDDDGRPCLDPRLRGDVGEVLRLVVVAEEALGEVAPVRLVGDPTVGVAEDVDGRDVDDARDAGRDGRIEDALGGVDVGLVHRRPLGGRDADPVRAGDVDDAVRAGHDLAQLRFGAEVAADEPRTDVRAGTRPRRSPGRGRSRRRRRRGREGCSRRGCR